MKRAFWSCIIVAGFCLSSSFAQQSSTAIVANAAVPTLVNFSGTLTDVHGKPLTGVVGVTFLLYKEEQGGSPLWLETQNVRPDASGRYSVMLGSTRSTGLPSDIFVAGEARWLSVQVQGQTEPARVMLLSVPYALKAGDAQTLNGLPASAFVMAPLATTPAGTSSSNPAASATALPPASTVTTTGGTIGTLPLWTTGTNIQSSALTQTGSGSTAKIGIGTTAPAATLDVMGAAFVRGIFTLSKTGTATASSGFSSQPLSLVGSSFNSSTNAAVNQTFRLQTEAAANNTANPSGTLNLLYGLGSQAFVETGLKISSKGLITFAAGQTYPGSITNVKAGTDLTGGGTSGVVTLNLDTTKVPQLGSANTFTTNQKVNGTLTATAFSGNGASVTNVNAATLGGLAAGAFAQLAANNTFSGNNTFNGFELINSAFVGPINNAAAGQLGVASPSVSFAAIGAAGFTPGDGSSQNGSDGIDSFGGTGDTTTTFNSGGNGVFGEGGTGFNGGNGIVGLGGGGGPCCIGSVDGDGGFFEGGSNSFNMGDGVYALTGSGFAGNFQGSINVTNTIFAGVKDFRIDHPLDPANKYLTHSSIESSEMVNIYSGNVTTDAQGAATVSLPDWFEVLNTDFRYQLTVIGQFAQAIIGQKIANHQFTIRTNAPNVEVSWQVTGVRQDAFAKANPLIVEEEKEPRLKGFYIHPEYYGAPPEKQIEWARHPEMLKQAKAMRARMNARQAKPTAHLQHQPGPVTSPD